jgi:hypothetical protein
MSNATYGKTNICQQHPILSSLPTVFLTTNHTTMTASSRMAYPQKIIIDRTSHAGIVLSGFALAHKFRIWSLCLVLMQEYLDSIVVTSLPTNNHSGDSFPTDES